jgi:hypothetical protein
MIVPASKEVLSSSIFGDASVWEARKTPARRKELREKFMREFSVSNGFSQFLISATRAGILSIKTMLFNTIKIYLL